MMMKELAMIRIAVVDDFSIVRSGLKQLLEAETEFKVVAEASTGEGALDLASKKVCDIMLLDLEMPRGNTGMETLRCIRETEQDLPILILSSHSEKAQALNTLREGADGYLPKTADASELYAAVRAIAAGHKYISSYVAELLANVRIEEQIAPHERLSQREEYVFKGLCEGRTLTGMASDLGLSVKTVGTYRMRIFQKIGCLSNAELMQYAIAHNLDFQPKNYQGQ